MRLQLTVICDLAGPPRSRSATVEVEVDAGVGTTARDLARVLTGVVGHPGEAASADPAVWVAGAAVPDEAPLGREPLVDGAAVSLVARDAAGRPAPRGPQRTPVVLAVAHGPDAGRSIELGAGPHTLGRSRAATICLDDPRISRLHAELTVGPGGIVLTDLGSTNGTFVDDVRLGGDPVPLVVGATVRIGDTLLVLRPAGGVPAAVTPRADGTRAVNRRPRLLAAPAPLSIALPTPPQEPHRARVPWIAMVLPVPFAAVMALFFGPAMLAFALMSPLLMAGTALSDRHGSRRRYAAEQAAYLSDLDAAQERVAAACAEEARLLRASLPDPSQTLAIARMPTARIWERRRADSDVLAVSIGCCTSPAGLRVIRPAEEGAEHPVLQRVPCELPLAQIGVAGFCGQRDAVMGVLRFVLGQLAALHSPRDLDFVLIMGSRRADDGWSWLGRLPHVRQADGRPFGTWVGSPDDDHASARAIVAELARRVRQRHASTAAPLAAWTGARTVVVLDGASALRSLPDLAEVLQCGPSVGICVVALDADRAELPSETSAVLDLAGSRRPQLHLPGSAATEVVVDRVGTWWADRLSRGLAPLRDATPAGGDSSLPAALDLIDLLGGGWVTGSPFTFAGDDPQVGGPPLDSAAVVRGWHDAAHRTAVPVGVTLDGAFTIDLAGDGPHILIAGTTGAGKSELLRTFVASLAVHNRPEHLSLVLVDYKGGAAFRECDALPHVAGVVTDLDDHLADRALASLSAELKRRERLFAEAEVTDFLSYQSSSMSRRQGPMARLVIVVDEFRALAQELPQLVDGIVRVAALGRSLGVHVVLATQRPAGVVTAEIKANVNLRIALRVRDRMDSDDVIDAPDAAGLDRTVPGRGYARCGGASLVRFQAAYAGGQSRGAEPRGIRARRVDWDRPAEPWPQPATDPGTVTDLGAVVAAVCEAALTVNAQPAAAPWLAPLPSRLTAASLPRDTTRFRIPIGLADEPAAQRQRPLEVDLAAPGHWGVVGAPGSGRSTALMTMGLTAASMLDATRLHVYVVSGGSLAPLAVLPHCGAHVDWDDLPRLERLVTRLSTEVADRRQRLAASPHATMGDWWRAQEAGAPPVLVVLVDDWEVLAQRTDEVTHGTLVERLLGTLREGAGVGFTAVVAGDRGLLVGRATSVLVHRVLLRLTDRADALLAGVAAEAVPRVQPPGRGVLLNGTEVQLALPPPVPPCLADVAVSPGFRPWRVDALPRTVDAVSLPTPEVPDDLVYLGVGGDTLTPLGLSPGRDGRRWVISGDKGAGISTTLALVAADALRRDQRVAVVARRAGPWDALRQDGRVLWCEDPAEPGELVALRQQVPDLVVVVDDADELLDSPVESALRRMASLVDRDRGLIAAGANAAAFAVQFRGLAVDLARHRTGVLLGPSSLVEAGVFGVRVPLDRSAVAGRGYLLRGGAATALQVALPRGR